MINLILPKTVDFFGAQFHLYGFIIGIAISIYIYLLEKDSKSDFSFNEILTVLFGVLIGARALHVFNELSYYSQDWSRVFELTNGGGSFFGGVFGALITIFVVCYIKKYQVLPNLDRFALYLPIAHAIGRIGNFINQELYGKPTDAVWGIYISPENRPSNYLEFESFHPVFAYEAMLNIILFLVLQKVNRNSPANGKIFSIYLIGYGIIRLVLMSIRIDRGYFIGIETAYFASVLFIIAGLLILKKSYKF